MKSFDDGSQLALFSLYEKTSSDIDRLRSRMPEPALKVLASEVLHRLAQKANVSPEHDQTVTSPRRLLAPIQLRLCN
jgi:hypothetical protein